MSKPAILVVDDSATQLVALQALLESHGYEVHPARSGEQALERIEKHDIGLVLSDIVMPGMSGYELCAAVKSKLGSEHAPPIVLLTSLSDPTDIVRGLECGADNYITKPYDPDHLLARLRVVLHNRELRRGRPRGGAVSIHFMGETFTVAAEREQILDLLLSSFEELIRTNDALQESQRALAAAHTRELEREQEARSQAEAAARRMEVLAGASAELSSSRDEETALHAVANLVVPALADACIIDVVAENGNPGCAIVHAEGAARAPLERVVSDAGGLAQWAGLPSDEGPVVIAPLPDRFFDNCPADSTTRDELRALGLNAVLIAGMMARGRRLGTFVLLCASDRCSDFADADSAHANELANRVALAVDNLRLFHRAERDRATAQDAAERIAGLYDSEKRARGEAEAATQARDEVLAIVSHDLRNPLGIIFTGTSLLLEVELEEAQRRQQLASIKRAAQQMDRLISDLLEASRMESGGLAITPAEHEAETLLRDAYDSFAPLAEEKHIALTVTAPAGLGTVNIDRERIIQVFSNLVGNAIKFTPDHGRVEIGARATDDRITFFVSDSGAGIPEADLPRIFDRFWQARKSAQAGAGLGLAIAKAIIEAHGGRIWAESNEGKGATFYFTIE